MITIADSVKIKIDGDDSGFEKELKKSEKSARSMAATLAGEYRKAGMSQSEAMKKAWSEVERTSDSNSKKIIDDVDKIGKESEKSASKFQRNMNKSLNVMGNLGNVAKRALKAVTVAVTAVAGAIATAGFGIVNVGKDFEKTAAKASTLFGKTAVDTKNLNKDILAMSSSTGVAATEFNEGLYSALSAGIPVTEDMSEAVGFLNKSSKLAVAGFTNVDTAISATAKTLNAYGLGVEETDRIQGILIATQNKGITTVGELGASLSQVTPTAAAFGVSFENVGAALATITAQGTPTAQATTQLNSLFAELGKQGTVAYKSLMQSAEGSKYAGMSFSEMMGSGASLSEVLSLMGVSANASDKMLLDMFGSIEAGKAALAITTSEGKVFNDNLLAMNDTAGAVDEAYEKMANTLDFQTKRMIESIKNLGIAIYTDNNEMLASVGKFANDMVAKLSTAYNEDGLAGLSTAIGEVIAETITKVAEAGPDMVKAASDLILSLIRGLSNNLPTIAKSAVEIVKTLISNILNMLPELLKMGIDLVIELAKGIAETLPELIPQAVACVATLIETMLDNIDMIIDTAIDLIMGLADGIINALPILIDKAPIIIQKLVDAIVNNVPKLIKAAIDLVVKFAKAIIDNIGKIYSVGKDIIKSICDGVVKYAKNMWDLGKNIVGEIWNGIVGAYDWVKNKIGEFFGGIIDSVLSFLGIESTNKGFADIGKQAVTGLSNGISTNASKVAESTQKMVNETASTISLLTNEAIKTAQNSEKELAKIQKKHQDETNKNKDKFDKEYSNTVDKTNKANTNTTKKNNDKKIADEKKAMKDIIDNTKKATKELAKEGQNISKEHQKNLDNILIANQKNLDNILIESKNNIKKIKDEYLKEIDSINNAVSSRANQLANPSNLFTDKEMTANGFINNMQSSKDKLESFNEELKKVMKLDISDDMKAEFKKLGVDSLEELKVINSMTNDEFLKYQSLWESQQKLAKDMAEAQYKQQREEAKAKRDAEIEEEEYNRHIALEKQNDKNQKAIDRENKRFDKECIKLNKKVDKAMADVGKSITKGLASGILTSKGQAILEAQRMADEITAIVNKSFDIHSPSKVFKGIGNNVGEGLGIGIKDSTNNVIKLAQSQADKLKEALTIAKQSVQYVFSAYAPQSAGISKGNVTTNNNTTNSPVINFNREVKSPDVVAREINNIFTHGLAGAR